ncbi:hypothetical protein JMUB7504_27260 [Staphylococcus aureus]
MTWATSVISAVTVTTQFTQKHKQSAKPKEGTTNLVTYVLNGPDTSKYVAISQSNVYKTNTIIPKIAYPIHAPKAPES